ncbi:MAG: zinc ribbon domain-containing protein [Thermodesulfobacteriota bacterium]
MVGYMHPCRYCSKLVPPESNVCPFCGKVNPLELRCPKCKSPIEEDWKRCSHCGISLELTCPKCGKTTFLGDYCKHCDSRLVVVCTKCKTEQSPIGEKCIKCDKPFKK